MPGSQSDAPYRAFLLRLLMVLVAVVLVALAFRLSLLLLMLFGGVLFAIALRAGARVLCRWTGLPPRFGVFAVLALVVALLGLMGWLVGAQVSDQFGLLAQRVPEAARQLGDWLRDRPWGSYLLSQSEGIAEGGGLFQGVTSFAFSAIGVITYVVLVLAIMIFAAVDPRLYREGLVRLFPIGARDRVREVEGAATQSLREWLLGQGISMAITGLLTTFGLMLVGAPLPVALGLLAGILDFIPYVGPILAAIPALLLGFSEGPRMVMWVALVYVVVQQIEGNVVVPIVQRRVVALPPVLTVLATVAMGMLFGFAGMLFATPLVVVAMVLVRKVYVEDVLGDRQEG